MSNAFVTLENLDKRYATHHAVKAINLDIRGGEFIALMGPSGCGKSTTLRLLAGLDQPTGGDIRIGGQSMRGIPAFQRDTPMVWQSLALFPFLSVVENVEFPLRMKKIGKQERRRRAMEWLERLGLGSMAERGIAQLSGGQRQRVAIARSLVTQPSILLLDEPLSALDAYLRVRMQTELSRLHKELGITFVYVTHAQSEAFALADRIVLMNDGAIQQTGRPQDVYREPANAFVAEFMGMNNIISGKVSGHDEGKVRIDGPLGTFTVPTKTSTSEQDKASFVIAADRISLSSLPTGGTAGEGVTGSVIGIEFVGSTQTIFFDVKGKEFRVQKQQHEIDALDVTPGKELTLNWQPQHAWLLPEAV
ncbi:ABC transporter ATP-binding protein [Rhizobium leguminosarum]|uniref:ABC transporter ATP-binding protein n=1 Tax=Rhizobium leguminosarum TaxID=384 RepID=UPI001C98403D|nr:ABC transporter ATP-binding protein [Rhizobium leguminosarum]MBY5639365.1 ABC transporter ATP-binding protein [Rhizobium leguminosarum]